MGNKGQNTLLVFSASIWTNVILLIVSRILLSTNKKINKQIKTFGFNTTTNKIIIGNINY